MYEYDVCLYCTKPIKFKSGPSLCKECDLLLFNEIRDYLNNNPNAKNSDIYINTHVTLKILDQYLDDERLEYIGKKLRDTNDLCFACEGETNIGKKYCRACTIKMKLLEEYSKTDLDALDGKRTYGYRGAKMHINLKNLKRK